MSPDPFPANGSILGARPDRGVFAHSAAADLGTYGAAPSVALLSPKHETVELPGAGPNASATLSPRPDGGHEGVAAAPIALEQAPAFFAPSALPTQATALAPITVQPAPAMPIAAHFASHSSGDAPAFDLTVVQQHADDLKQAIADLGIATGQAAADRPVSSILAVQHQAADMIGAMNALLQGTVAQAAAADLIGAQVEAAVSQSLTAVTAEVAALPAEVLGTVQSDVVALMQVTDSVLDTVTSSVSPIVDHVTATLADRTTAAVADLSETVITALDQTAHVVAPVVEQVAATTTALTDTVTEAVAPVTPAVAAVVEQAAEMTAAITDTVASIVAATTPAVEAVASSVGEPITAAVVPAVEQVVATADPIVEHALAGSDPAGGIATLTSLVSAADMFQLHDDSPAAGVDLPDALGALGTLDLLAASDDHDGFGHDGLLGLGDPLHTLGDLGGHHDLDLGIG